MSLKQLNIKTNVVKRIYKEHIAYGKEAETQQKRIDKLVAEGADDADIRKQKEVLEETYQMIPDVKKRLGVAYKELQEMTKDEAYASSSELAEAVSTLQEIDPDQL
ncbi:tubulin binding cofactor A [Gongronella butleri]|nr:tubulin binding cofactor A [Gongronella butleri]